MRWLNNLRVSRKVLLGFGLIIGALLVIGFILFRAITGIERQNSIVSTNTELLHALNQIELSVSRDMLLFIRLVEAEELKEIEAFNTAHQNNHRQYAVNRAVIDSLSSLDQANRIDPIFIRFKDSYERQFYNRFKPSYDTMKTYRMLEIDFENEFAEIEVLRNDST